MAELFDWKLGIYRLKVQTPGVEEDLKSLADLWKCEFFPCYVEWVKGTSRYSRYLVLDQNKTVAANADVTIWRLADCTENHIKGKLTAKQRSQEFEILHGDFLKVRTHIDKKSYSRIKKAREVLRSKKNVKTAEREDEEELEDENALLHRFVQELKEGQQAASKEINKPLQGVPFDQTLSGSSNYRYSTLSGSFQGQTLEESRALADDAQEHDFRGSRRRESTSDPGSHEIQLRQSKSLISEQSELSLLQVWTQEVRPKSRRSADDLASIPRMKSVSSIGSFTSGFEDVLPREGLRSGDVLYEKSCIQQFMLNPNSWVSVLWDFVTVLFVFYDLITLPLQVFNLQSGVLSTGDLLVAITWTLDIVVSFLRGVTDRGAVDMRPTYVAMKYLRSWFLLDLFVVVTDWILLLSGGLEDMEVLRVLRGRIFLRLLRVLRLVRLIKLPNDCGRLKEAILNDHNKAVSSVLQLLFVVVMINHYVGCGWFAVGQVEGFDKSWVSEHLTGEGDQHVLSQYLTSVHWAAMEVVPVNSAERMYAIVVIFSGLVMFSSFVSSMTSAMDLINKLNFEQRQKSTALRQYITENRVSLELLSMRALEPKKLHECDVVLFKNLPEDLLQRLHSEVYGPVIAMHPLFGHLQGKEDSMMLGICHLAMSERSLVIGEELFRYGTPGSKIQPVDV
eukprot:symbB.v1.2.013315.t1/scaffold938.1/size150240/8